MNSTKLNVTYWLVLGVLTIGILLSAVPSVLKLPYAVEHFCTILQLPEYLLAFTGAFKLAGIIALYVPGFPKLKEWVFAGFSFDLVGAWYCNYVALNSFMATVPILLYMLLLVALYFLHNRRLMIVN